MSRYTNEQILAVVRWTGKGLTINQVAKRVGLSSAEVRAAQKVAVQIIAGRMDEEPAKWNRGKRREAGTTST